MEADDYSADELKQRANLTLSLDAKLELLERFCRLWVKRRGVPVDETFQEAVAALEEDDHWLEDDDERLDAFPKAAYKAADAAANRIRRKQKPACDADFEPTDGQHDCLTKLAADVDQIDPRMQVEQSIAVNELIQRSGLQDQAVAVLCHEFPEVNEHVKLDGGVIANHCRGKSRDSIRQIIYRSRRTLKEVNKQSWILGVFLVLLITVATTVATRVNVIELLLSTAESAEAVISEPSNLIGDCSNEAAADPISCLVKTCDRNNWFNLNSNESEAVESVVLAKTCAPPSRSGEIVYL